MASNQPTASDATKQGDDIPGMGRAESNVEIIEEAEIEEDATPEAEIERMLWQHPITVTEDDLYKFTPLDEASQEMRFLTLLPHNGDTSSVLQCTISIEPLTNCAPYAFLNNTRGNPFDVGWLLLPNGKKKSVFPNIWTFLHHIRSATSPQRFWFRDVCLHAWSAEEKAQYWNQEWMDTMRAHASSVMDVADVLTHLWDEGKLQIPFPRRPKWDREFRDPSFKMHSPIPLRLAAEIAQGAPRHMEQEYLPLDYVANEIRLITLEAADNYEDALMGMLGYNPMHNNASYTCVSYMKNDEEATEEIDLSGQRLMIPKSLDMFLRTVRRPTGYVRLWIDFICIDQKNEEERKRQLPRMLEIFESADAVACWLGEGDECSDTALNLVNDIVMPRFHGEIVFALGWVAVQDEEDFPRRLAALYRFLCHPSFRQIEVVQELAVSRHPFIQCGNKSFEWSRLNEAAWRVLDIVFGDPELFARMKLEDPTLETISPRDASFARQMFYIRHLLDRGIDEEEENVYQLIGVGGKSWVDIPESAPGILDLVVMCRGFQSTLPHDKVFALWNIAMDTKDMDFPREYTISLAQTWQDFAVEVASKTGSLDIICEAEPASSQALSLPSWCPDWSTPAAVSSMVRQTHIPLTLMRAISDLGGPRYSAAGCGRLTPRFSFSNSVLECAGVILDTVDMIGDYEPTVSLSDEEALWDKWKVTAASELQSPEDAALPAEEQDFSLQFQAVLAGLVLGSDKIESRIRFIPATGKKDALIKSNGRDHLSATNKGRRLIITEGKRMGLAPHYVTVGMKLAILSCASSPVLLEANVDGMYHLRGSCFVQGWMVGEMLKQFGETDEEAWEAINKQGRLKIV